MSERKSFLVEVSVVPDENAGERQQEDALRKRLAAALEHSTAREALEEALRGEVRLTLAPRSEGKITGAMSTSLNDRDLATVLFALRFLQSNFDGEVHKIAAVSEHFEGLQPPTEEFIDDLCERLNRQR